MLADPVEEGDQVLLVAVLHEHLQNNAQFVAIRFIHIFNRFIEKYPKKLKKKCVEIFKVSFKGFRRLGRRGIIDLKI